MCVPIGGPGHKEVKGEWGGGACGAREDKRGSGGRVYQAWQLSASRSTTSDNSLWRLNVLALALEKEELLSSARSHREEREIARAAVERSLP